jgi:hypothetical protein
MDGWGWSGGRSSWAVIAVRGEEMLGGILFRCG